MIPSNTLVKQLTVQTVKNKPHNFPRPSQAQIPQLRSIPIPIRPPLRTLDKPKYLPNKYKRQDTNFPSAKPHPRPTEIS